MSDASSSSGRRITVTSVSCRGVKSFVPFQKPPLYVAVSLGGRREKSPADPDGGENPDWDGAVFAFDLDGAGEGDTGLLQFEVKAQVPLLGNKLVGTTCVPVSHLGDGRAPERVSYQVLAPDGKPNGSLSFVYVVTGGSAHQQPQIYAAPNGARLEQDFSSCCAPPPPPPPSGSAYTSPTMPNFAPHGSSYPPAPRPPSGSAYPPPTTPNPNFAPHGSSYPPPPVSASLYPPPPPDMLPPSHYRPPPQMMDSLFPASNSGLNSCYPPPPPPPPLTTAYPPAPAPCASYSVASTQDISNYPSPPPRYYPPLPPSGYPPPQMNPEFPAPASSYPPPPSPDSGSISSVLTRSTRLRSMDHEFAPSFQDSVVTYPELPGPPVPSAGSYYPPSGLWHHNDGASSPYYYPQPGARYS